MFYSNVDSAVQLQLTFVVAKLTIVLPVMMMQVDDKEWQLYN